MSAGQLTTDPDLKKEKGLLAKPGPKSPRTNYFFNCSHKSEIKGQ